MLMILARLVRSESFWAVVKVRSPHTGPEVCYIIDKAVCYLTRGTFKEDSNDAGFIDTRWVELEELYENCGKTPLKNALKKYRKAEEEDVDAAIADFEEGVEHEG